MFDNTLKLTRFMLKREKVTSTAWILSMVTINFLIVMLMGVALMPDAAERAEFMYMLANPALLAMIGPLYSPDITTIGALYTLMMLVFMGVTVAIMNIFLVVRHTRADEEAGRYEVIRSLPSGRLASVNAAMLTAIVVNIVMSLLFALTMWLGMIIVNEPMGFGAALLWGASMGVVGITFAAVAALFSQLSSTGRGALSYSFLALGLFYFIRAGADMNPDTMEALAYFSPFGLASRTWVYINNVWWPLLISLAIALVFTALAYWLCSFRDIEQGIIPARPGKAKGGVLMKSSLGLNFRLLRTSLIAWTVLLFLIGFSYSTVLQDMDMFIASNEMYRQLMLGPSGLLDYIVTEGMTTEQIAAQLNTVLGAAGFNIVQMFANMTGFVMAMMAAIPVLLFVLKAKNEEKAIRAELIFATPSSRTKYLVGLVIISFVSAIIIQAAQALGMFSLAQSALENPADLPLRFLLESSLVYVPAMWIFAGITVFLVGLLPRFTGWIWAYYGYTFFAMMYGRMLPEIEWMANITPLGWVPQLPMDEINRVALIIMAAVGIALAAAGIFFYNKRDINAVTQ